MLFSQIIALASSAVLVAAAPKPIPVTEDDVILYGNGRYVIMKRDIYADLEAARKNHTMPPEPCNLNKTMHSTTGKIPPKPSGGAPAPSGGAAPSGKAPTPSGKAPTPSGKAPTPSGKAPTPSGKPATGKPKGDEPPAGKNGTHKADTESLSKRDSVTIIVPNAPNRFLGWDVQMSAVVKGAPTSIYVASGYSIANAISVGESVSVTLVEDFLESSTNIDYTKTWTSTQTQQFTASVPAGKYGAFVSNPWTNRQSGNVFQGSIGSTGSLTYYQADSFDSKDYGGLAWVDGVISLCTGDTFPLPRCLGGGTL